MLRNRVVANEKLNSIRLSVFTLLAAALFLPGRAPAQMVWTDYAANSQHTALSTVASQSLQGIVWQTPVDLNPQYRGDDLLIHYGSPLITMANTVLVPVKTGATGSFRIDALNGADGTLKWQFDSDYVLPPHNWTPSFSPTVTPKGRLYLPGAGGTVYYRDGVDNNSGASGQIAFFGLANYNANKSAFNNTVKINTPITSDAQGNIYFGFQVTGANPSGLQNGIARIDASGNGTYVPVTTATGGLVTKVVMNAAPALSNDGKTLYVAMSNGNFSSGYLVALDSTTLATNAKVLLKDPRGAGGNNALLPDDGTASPMVAPDGRVYFGVLENPFGTARGWLLQFNADLTRTSAMKPGAFGWDDTASIVPASMVPSYHGASTYLLMTKYNNYAGLGGDGVNKLAILDPNDSQVDPRTGVMVMKEILTIAGPTHDDDFPGLPNAVREWCINTAAVDPFSFSVLANSEDGKLYRWDLRTNTFTEEIVLTSGIGEAYTPTLIGADGKVYAINNATLFAVGVTAMPEPGTLALLMGLLATGVAVWRQRRR